MCKAIEDLKAESMAEGMAEGMAKGRAEGRAEGILSTLTDLVRKGLLTITQADGTGVYGESGTETVIQAGKMGFCLRISMCSTKTDVVR